MTKTILIVGCSVVFSLIGLLAGFLVIANLPPVGPRPGTYDVEEWRVILLSMLALGPTFGGAILGLFVGVFAAIFWPHAIAPEVAGAEDRAVTQLFVKKN